MCIEINIKMGIVHVIRILFTWPGNVNILFKTVKWYVLRQCGGQLNSFVSELTILHQVNKHWWISVNRFKSCSLITVIIYISSKICAIYSQIIRKGIMYSEALFYICIILTIHTGVHLSYAVLRLPRNKCKFLQINTK